MSFKDLDLSSVEFSSTPRTLKPGEHTCEVSEARYDDTKSGGSAVYVTFKSTDGDGSIRTMFNVVNKNPTAARIGQEQLKTMLTFGGHPNPDHPSDISSLLGLKVGVRVGPDTWRDMNGVEQEGSKVKGYFQLGDGGVSSPSTSQPQSNTGQTDNQQDEPLDDDIPF